MKRVLHVIIIWFVVMSLAPLQASALTVKEKEGNDSFETAMKLPKVTRTHQVKASLTNEKDEDFYSFDVDSGGLTIALSVEAGASYYVRLYNELEDVIGSMGTEIYEKDEQVYFMAGLKQGTYTVHVVDSSGRAITNAVNYKLMLTYDDTYDYEQEWNDDEQHATPLALNRPTIGFFDQPGSSDYYKVTLKKNGKVTLAIQADDAVNYELYTAAGKTIVKGLAPATKGKEWTRTMNVKKGTYYLTLAPEERVSWNEPMKFSVSQK